MSALWVRCWWELAVAAMVIRSPWRWRYLNAPLASRRQAGADVGRVWRVMWAASLRHVKPMTCLEYSAALHRLLKRRGIDCRLRIGATEPERGKPLAAHAWVELPDGTRLEMAGEGSNFLPLEGRR